MSFKRFDQRKNVGVWIAMRKVLFDFLCTKKNWQKIVILSKTQLYIWKEISRHRAKGPPNKQWYISAEVRGNRSYTISGHLIGHPIFQHQTQKHLKKHLLYYIRYSIMPFLAIDGHNIKIDNNTFDTMGKFNVLSKQTQTAFHLSTLRNKHLKQNKYIKT